MFTHAFDLEASYEIHDQISIQLLNATTERKGEIMMELLDGIIRCYENTEQDIVIYNERLKALWKNKETLPDNLAPQNTIIPSNETSKIPLPCDAIWQYKLNFKSLIPVYIHPIIENGETIYHVAHFYDSDEIQTLMERSFLHNYRISLFNNISLKLSSLLQVMNLAKFKDYSYDDIDRYIRNNVDRSLSFLTNIVSLSKFYSGDVKCELVSIGQTTKDLLNRFKPYFEGSGYKLVTDIQPGLFAALDVKGYESVISNLIINGLRYNSKDEKVITIKIMRKKNQVTIAVTDNGDGMTRKQIRDCGHLESSFDPQNHTEHLGLAVVRQFCRFHNGTMEITSELDKFTKVELTLCFPEVNPPAYLKSSNRSFFIDHFDLTSRMIAKYFEIDHYTGIMDSQANDQIPPPSKR